MRIVNTLLDLLFPPRCPFCDRLLGLDEKLICTRCQALLPWLQGEEQECKVEFAHRCVSPLSYRDAVRQSFHRYKFEGRRDYACAYAALMVQCVRDRLGDEEPELVTYVPVSSRRRRSRGYDQARLLAEGLARQLKLPLTVTLRKARHTPAQSGLRGPEERRANVLGAYELAKGARVEGRCVLLVDDIVTTGSTLSECARVLCTAGARRVVCVTLARAGK